MSPEELMAVINVVADTAMEGYYWWATAIMIAIHAGFMMYEMGASRAKNVMHTGVKNILAFAFTIPAFFVVGWWAYWAYQSGNIFIPDWNHEFAQYYVPWGDQGGMGPNHQDGASGIFWAAFTLFAMTTASIVSGSVIERIKMSGWLILVTIFGGFIWIVGAGWGWSTGGWLVVDWGFRDVCAAGVVHMAAGFFALGVLVNLGPRQGRFNADGSTNEVAGHSGPMAAAGLMVIILGFFGFLGACLIYPSSMAGTSADLGWINIYGIKSNLSAFAFNTLMGMAGGIMAAWWVTRDAFWMMGGALCGIISVASGIDLWYPGTAFVVGAVGGLIMPYCHKMLTSWGIDDAVGAVSVHGFVGIWGVMSVGILLGGYPAPSADIPAISFTGQLVGAISFFLLGFVPGYVLSWILNKAGMLRYSEAILEKGVDTTEGETQAYPDFQKSA